MLMEVDWLNIMLIVISMVKRVVKFVVSMVRGNIVLVVLLRVWNVCNLMGQSI